MTGQGYEKSCKGRPKLQRLMKRSQTGHVTSSHALAPMQLAAPRTPASPLQAPRMDPLSRHEESECLCQEAFC